MFILDEIQKEDYLKGVFIQQRYQEKQSEIEHKQKQRLDKQK